MLCQHLYIYIYMFVYCGFCACIYKYGFIHYMAVKCIYIYLFIAVRYIVVCIPHMVMFICPFVACKNQSIKVLQMARVSPLTRDSF